MGPSLNQQFSWKIRNIQVFNRREFIKMVSIPAGTGEMRFVPTFSVKNSAILVLMFYFVSKTFANMQNELFL